MPFTLIRREPEGGRALKDQVKIIIKRCLYHLDLTGIWNNCKLSRYCSGVEDQSQRASGKSRERVGNNSEQGKQMGN